MTQPPPRELLIVNARLWSPDHAPQGDSLLLAHGRIAAIGTALELRTAAPHARELDANGATVTPGLCDAHLHFVPWAQSRRQPDLHGTPSRAAALRIVAAALAADSSPAPLVGRGWDETGWEALPDRPALDALAPERAVLLHRHDFHALWVNSAALRAAGITRASRDPEGGVFVRDASGELTGLVRENAVSAFRALEAQAGPVIDDALLDEAAAALHANGITSVHDFQRGAIDIARMRALASRGRLRVLQQVGLEALEHLAAAGLASGVGDEWFRIGALKLFADGTLGSHTAAMLLPYDDARHTGMKVLAPAALREQVTFARRAGFATSIHAIGDAAVRDALDAFESAADACEGLAPPALPSRIEHVQLLDPADRARFATLGIAASMQPQHCVTDAKAARAAWGARCANAYAWEQLRAAGALLAFGSDAPVEPPVATLGLHAALTRVRPDGQPAGGFEPGQAVTFATALRAYTEGPARLSGLWPRAGRLAVGALADVVGWDRDLETASPESLLAARPTFTALGGEIVYHFTGAGAAVAPECR